MFGCLKKKRGKRIAAVGEEVISCRTVAHWTQQFVQAKHSKNLVVIVFTADWCGPCRKMDPVIVDHANRFHNVSFLKVDVDDLESVVEEWEIEATPTFFFLKEGNIVDKIVGANVTMFSAMVWKHL